MSPCTTNCLQQRLLLPVTAMMVCDRLIVAGKIKRTARGCAPLFFRYWKFGVDNKVWRYVSGRKPSITVNSTCVDSLFFLTAYRCAMVTAKTGNMQSSSRVILLFIKNFIEGLKCFQLVAVALVWKRMQIYLQWLEERFPQNHQIFTLALCELESNTGGVIIWHLRKNTIAKKMRTVSDVRYTVYEIH